jgi:hypothetical protein
VGIEENDDSRLRLNVIGANNDPDRVFVSLDVVPVVVDAVNAPAGGAVGGKLTT